MQPRLCLNAATIKNASLERQVRIAGAAGYHGVGLWMDDIDAALQRGSSLKEVAAFVRHAGLSVEEICFLGRWQDCDAGDFPSVLEEADRMSLVSRELGCGVMVAVPALGHGAWTDAPRRFRDVCDVAAGHDVKVALEFVGTADGIRDITSARRLVEESGSPNGGLLLDTFHFFLGGSRPEELAGIPAEKIFLVHVSDAMAVSRARLCAFHDSRTFPGSGTIDFGPLRAWLAVAEYRGAVSLEIWNQEMLKGDPERTAIAGFESLRALFAIQGGI
jgi:4-hydroxyphenylpyruvate dioxygenase